MPSCFCSFICPRVPASPVEPNVVLDMYLLEQCLKHVDYAGYPQTCQMVFKLDSLAWKLGVLRASAIAGPDFHLIVLGRHGLLLEMERERDCHV